MTIEEAIKVLRSLYNVQRLDTLTQEEMTAVAMAIRSLKAWEKVREEIEKEEVIEFQRLHYGESMGLHRAKDIIVNVLKEVDG